MKCPYCAAQIPTQAIVCRYCGRDAALKLENERLQKKTSSLAAQVSKLADLIKSSDTSQQEKPTTSNTLVAFRSLTKVADQIDNVERNRKWYLIGAIVLPPILWALSFGLSTYFEGLLPIKLDRSTDTVTIHHIGHPLLWAGFGIVTTVLTLLLFIPPLFGGLVAGFARTPRRSIVNPILLGILVGVLTAIAIWAANMITVGAPFKFPGEDPKGWSDILGESWGVLGKFDPLVSLAVELYVILQPALLFISGELFASSIKSLVNYYGKDLETESRLALIKVLLGAVTSSILTVLTLANLLAKLINEWGASS